MIVLDASAAVRALLGDATARAHLAQSPLVAPHLIDTEVAHGLRGLCLGRQITNSDAAAMMQAWSGLGITRFAMHPLTERVWELRQNLSAYDATYVALAEEIAEPLLTADARLAAAPGVRCEIRLLATRGGAG